MFHEGPELCSPSLEEDSGKKLRHWLSGKSELTKQSFPDAEITEPESHSYGRRAALLPVQVR
jgi:hypothetical protein